MKNLVLRRERVVARAVYNTHNVSTFRASASVVLLPNALSVVLNILVVRDNMLLRPDLIVVASDQNSEQEQKHEHTRYYLARYLSMSPRHLLAPQ